MACDKKGCDTLGLITNYYMQQQVFPSPLVYVVRVAHFLLSVFFNGQMLSRKNCLPVIYISKSLMGSQCMRCRKTAQNKKCTVNKFFLACGTTQLVQCLPCTIRFSIDFKRYILMVHMYLGCNYLI